jgi:acylphosphatase
LSNGVLHTSFEVEDPVFTKPTRTYGRAGIGLEMAHSVDGESLSFEVWGKVQGVFFRKHTAKEANRLGLRGWVMNTKRGTVRGEVHGNPESMASIRQWLSTVGSPRSTIERAEFKAVSKDPKRLPFPFEITR